LINEFLAFLSGLQQRSGVTVLAATNRPDQIDEAARRAGRLGDEIIYVGVPDPAARLQALRIHTRGMPLGRDVDLSRLVDLTEDYTGADLEAVVVQAGLAALREDPNAVAVEMRHFLGALDDVGPSVTSAERAQYEELAKQFTRRKKR
jgi:transitional endoplasmic reticulum ATPase